MTTFRETSNWLPGSTKISKNEKWIVNYTSHQPQADFGNFVDVKKKQMWLWVREYNEGSPKLETTGKNIPQYVLDMVNRLFKS